MNFRALVLILVALAFCDLGFGQDSPEPNEKAARYHKALLRRPAPGYLFDRFYDAWLDTSGVEELGRFLEGRASPPDADAAEQLLLAFFHAKQGDDANARIVFKAVLEREPEHAAAWFQKAKIEARSLNFDAAIADLDSAIAAEPDEDLAIEIAKYKGQLLTRNGKKDSAIEVWQALLAEHPDDDELHEDLIELQLDEGLYEEAAATSRALIDQTTDPYSRVLRELRLGDVQQRAGDRESALELYVGTLKQTGSDTWIEREVLAQIEELFRREDDLEGLLEEFRFLLDADPQRLSVRRRRAELLAEQGLEEESIAAWKEILELTPGDRTIREAFVRSLAKAGRLEEAVKQMRALAELHPDDAELLVILASFQAQSGDGESAGASLLAYLEKAGKTEYAFLRTTRLLTMFKLFEEAESVYQQLLADFPDSVAAKENFAAFLYDQERQAEALEVWKNLAESGDAAQAVRIARTLTSRREFEVAFETLKARYDELGTEPIFLTQLCETAMHAQRPQEAFEWARRRVILSRDALDLTESVKLAARVARSANEEAARIAELQAIADRGIRETCLLAELLEEDGSPDEAEALLTNVEGEDATLALAQLVRIHRGRGNWELAAETQERLIDLPGGKNSAQIQALVLMHERNFDFAEAARWIEEWKKLSPGSVSPWLRLANLQSADGEFEEAVQTLRSASQRFDDSPEIRAKLADAYHSLGKLADAERLYWRLYEDEADSAGKTRWVTKLAFIARELDQVERLIADFEERRRGNRTSILPLLALAEIHEVTGNDSERRQAILEAIRLQPKDLGLLHQLARIEENDGQVDAAIRTLESALRHDPTNRTRDRLARLHFRQGDFDRALAVLREGGGALDPEQLLETAQQLFSAGAWEQAAEILAPFLDEHPDDYRLFYLHALALEESGQKDRAAAAFERLLGFQRDLPGADQLTLSIRNNYGVPMAVIRKLTPDEIQEQRLFRKVESRLPPATLEISRVLDAEHQAYNYRQGRPEGRIYGFHSHYGYGYGFGYGFGGGSRSTVIAQPVTAADARAFAIQHLHRIASEDEERLAAFENALSAQGLPGFVFELLNIERRRNQSDEPYERNDELREFLREHADDPVVAALWINDFVYVVAEAELAAKTMKSFRESEPILAIQAVLNSGLTNKLGEEEEIEKLRSLISEALALLENLEPGELFPDDIQLLQDFLYAVVPYPDMPEEDQIDLLTSEQQKTLIELALRETERLWPMMTPGQRSDHDSEMRDILSGFGQLELYLAHLGRMTRDYRENIALRRRLGSSMLSSVSYETSVGDALRFPPLWIPEIPHRIRGQFSPTPYSEDYYYPPDPEKLAELIGGIEDPYLRLLVAFYCKKPAEIDEAVAELAAREPPTADALLTAATWAVSREENPDPAAAGEFLLKARALPADPATRWLIDVGLIQLALREDDENSPIREAGRSAAMRIQATNHYPDQDGNLFANVLAALGLRKEAHEFRFGSIRRSPPPPSRPPRIPVNLGQPRGIVSRAVDLMESGQPEAAARVAARHLKPLATAVLDHVQRTQDNEYGLLRERLKIKDLTAAVIEEARPEAEAGRLDRVQFACLLDILDETEAAIAAYRQLLDEDPGDGSIRRRLAVLLAFRGDERVLELLEEIRNPGESPAAGLNLLFSSWSEAPDFETKRKIAELAIRWLEEADPIPISDNFGFYAGRNVLNQMSSYFWVEGIRLDGLFMEWDEEQTERMRLSMGEEAWKRREELNALQRDLHDRAAEAMARHPALAGFAFAQLSALRIRDEGEAAEPELIALARETLLAIDEPVFYDTGYHLQGAINEFEPSSEPPDSWNRQLGPFEFLVQTLGRRGDRETLAAVAKELRADEAKAEMAEILELWVDLYFCEPENYLETAAALTEAWDHENRAPIFVRPVIEIWRERELHDEVDLFPWAASIFQIQELHPSKRSVAIQRLAAAGAESSGPEFVDRCLEWAAERYLGPEEGRAAFIEKHFYDWVNYEAEGDGVKLAQFVEFLNLVGGTPEFSFPATELLVELDLHRSNQYDALAYPFMHEGMWREAEVGIRRLSRSPFVTGVADFHPNVPEAGLLAPDDPFTSRGIFERVEGATLEGMMALQIQYCAASYENTRQAYREWALSQPEDAFAARLLAAVLNEDDRDAEFFRVLGEFSGEIRAMDEERRLAIAQFVLEMAHLISIPAEASGDGAAIWREFEEIADSTGKDVEQLLNAELVTDLGGITPYELDEHVTALIRPRLSRKPDEALAIFQKTLELEIATRKRGLWDYALGSGETMGGEIFERLIDEVSSFREFRFVALVLEDPKTLPTELQLDRDNVSQPFSRVWSRFHEDGKAEIDTAREVFGAIAKELEGVETTPMSLGICEFLLDQLTAAELPEFLAWARSAEAEGLLAAELAAAAEIRIAWFANDEQKVDVPAGPAAFYVSRLRDESIPLALRLERASHHVSDLHSLPTREMTFAAVECLAEAWENFFPTYYYSSEWVPEEMNRFETDAEWQALARRLAAAFNHRYIDGEGPDRLNNEPDRDCIRNLIVMNLLLADLEGAEELLKRWEYEFGYMIEVFAHLVNAGEFDRAIRLMRHHIDDLDGRETPESIRWTPEFAEKVWQLLERIESPSQRFLAETLLVSLDGESRSERLVDVATRFVESGGGRGGALREKVIEQLADQPESRRIVGDLLWELVEPVRLSALMDHGDNEWAERIVELHNRAALLALETRDFERFDQLFERARLVAPERTHRRGEFWKMVLQQFYPILQDPKFDAEAAREFLPKLRELALIEDRPSDAQETAEHLGWVLFATDLADEWDSLEAWLAEQEEEKAELLREEIDSYRAMGTALNIVAERMSSAPVEERIQFAQRFFAQPILKANLKDQKSEVFYLITRMGLLDYDELSEQGEAMAEADWRGGYAWADLAEHGRYTGDEREIALEYWDRAIDGIPAQDVEGRIRCRMGKIRALHALDREEEARAEFASLDPENIPRSLKLSWRQLGKTLQVQSD